MPTPVSVFPVPAAKPARPAPGGEGWRLLYQGWTLSTPDGQRLNLTAIERACFLCLLESPQRELTRHALARSLPRASVRTINVSISRLRKKVRNLGATLPLHTVHGMGYVFLGQLVSESVPT